MTGNEYSAEDASQDAFVAAWTKLDTLKEDEVPELPGAWLSDYGARWDILIVPLFSEDLTSRILCGMDTPPMGGWFVGRNDKKLHKSSTLTMTVSGKECRFATLLIPFERNQDLPRVEKVGPEVFKLILKGTVHTIDLANLKEE